MGRANLAFALNRTGAADSLISNSQFLHNPFPEHVRKGGEPPGSVCVHFYGIESRVCSVSRRG